MVILYYGNTDLRLLRVLLSVTSSESRIRFEEGAMGGLGQGTPSTLTRENMRSDPKCATSI